MNCSGISKSGFFSFFFDDEAYPSPEGLPELLWRPDDHAATFSLISPK
jgi:hypothetical protein